MQLWLTVVGPSSRVPVEIWVRAPAGCTVGELRPLLGRVIPEALRGRTGPAELYVDGARLGEDDRLGIPPLLDGAVIQCGPPTTDTPRTLGILQLAVTGGPDAGHSIPLGPGRHTMGRSTAATIRIEDPDLSRAHLTIDVAGGSTLVTDLRTTNGTRLDGRPLSGATQPWSVHGRMRAGSTTLELRSGGLGSAATTFDGEGHISVNRQPRHLLERPDVEVRLPSRPEQGHRGRLPLLSLLIPLALAGPMAWLQRSPVYLLFGLMSPAMMLGSFVSDRRGRRRDERRRQARWQDEMAAAQAELADALTAEAGRRRSALPDAAELLQAAIVPLARLWERRRGDLDFLTVRVGLGRATADVRVVDPNRLSEPPAIEDVPIGLSLKEVGVLGLAGPRPGVAGLARCLVAQLAGWHSPRDVSLMVLATEDTDRGDLLDWTWAARLPHTRPDFLAPGQAWVGLQQPEQLRQRVAELTAVLDERVAARDHSSSKSWPGPHIVVVLDGARTLRRLPGLARVLELGPDVGIQALCLDAERNLLPAECTAVIELSRKTDGPAVTIRDRLGGMSDLVIDAVSPGWADRFGRAMAPLRDATPERADADVPEQARLVDLIDVDPTDPTALGSRWRAAPRSAVATLGATNDGPYAIDLRHDGPHILIGGTTGSGKSELLQTLIASLAIANSPEHLGFVLVDYKGGSAFDACAELPHTLGLVTDLDPHLTARALASLDAELTRRETLLRDRGAKDLDDYARLVGRAGPPLARLVLVIDEFRMLSEELPAFLDGLVRIGAVGRSLGVHLVLATQRPAGVVSADIAANVNLRIALRVRDQADSEDVIESRAAAAISPRTPGRALARSASNPLVLFQTARVAGSATLAEALHVERLTLDQLGESRAIAAVFEPSLPSTDLSSIVRATQTAARNLALTPSRRPWLPPLPNIVTLDQLATITVGSRVPYAVVDRPDRQAQETVAWDLDRDTHLVIAGTLRSGRSSCLRTLAGSLATRFSPDSVQVHAIDGGTGSLRPLAELPHCGVVAAGDDVPRGVQLLDRLATEVANRQSTMSAAGFGSLAEQHAQVEPAQQLPYLVLLLDGWESLAAAWEQIEHGRPIETLMQLMRDGAAVGLRVAVTGDRALLMSRLAALVRDKIVLRLADPADLVLAGVPAAVVPRHLSPGRGVRVTDHAEVQIALLSEDGSGTGQAHALERIAARAEAAMSTSTADSAPSPLRIEPLPRQIGYAEVAARMPRPMPGWALLGVGGDAGTPVGLALPGSSAIVAGPPRSGRSTTLATMARWLTERGVQVVAVTADRGGLAGRLSDVDRLQIIEPADAGRLRDLLSRVAAPCVLVDDGERIVDTEAEDVVLQWFKGPTFDAGSLIVAGSSVEMAVAFRGLSVAARRSGQGILLNPTTYSDGELLGVRTPPGTEWSRHPGRGLLVQDGRCTPIQVAQ